MLIDITLGARNPSYSLFLNWVGEEPLQPIRLGEGLYQIGHFNLDLVCLTRLKRIWDLPALHLATVSPYGVCDSPEQLMKLHGEDLKASLFPFVISFTEIRRDKQSPSGGWRWHKWGPYIGEHEPTTEYLYDEPKIERVFVYSIYQVDSEVEWMPG